MWTPERIEIGRQFFWAIDEGDVDLIRTMCHDHPWLVANYQWDGESTWIGVAAREGRVEVMAALLDLGFDINALSLPERCTALGTAIGFKHWDLVRFMLDRGADPNLDRTTIRALNIKDSARRQQVLDWLLDAGVDVNQMFELYGDPDNLFTALDWVEEDPEMAAYLRSRGAKTASELTHDRPKADTTDSIAHAVAAFLGDHSGTSTRKSLIEIVPTGHPIAIHAIRPNEVHQHLILYTFGMSDRLMITPPGQEEYCLAELFIELPADWPLASDVLAQAQFGWPISWLRQLARYPFETGTWFGNRAAVIANGHPSQPIAPEVPFTSWMVVAQGQATVTDSRVIQVYRAVPLYPEEHELEQRDGVQALLAAFESHGISLCFDPVRPNAARSE